jgi:hypothetical protein
LDGGLGGELRGRVGFSFVNQARGFRVEIWMGTGGGLAPWTNPLTRDPGTMRDLDQGDTVGVRVSILCGYNLNYISVSSSHWEKFSAPIFAGRPIQIEGT